MQAKPHSNKVLCTLKVRGSKRIGYWDKEREEVEIGTGNTLHGTKCMQPCLISSFPEDRFYFAWTHHRLFRVWIPVELGSLIGTSAALGLSCFLTQERMPFDS